MRVIKAEAERLIELAAQDDDLRADLRALAEAILAATEAGQPKTDAAPPKSPSEAAPGSTARKACPGARRCPTLPGADSQQWLNRSGNSRWEGGALEEQPPICFDGDALVKNHSDDLARSEPAAGGKARRLAGQRNACDGSVRGTRSRSKTRRWTRMVEWADRLTDCFYWMKPRTTPASRSLLARRCGRVLRDDGRGVRCSSGSCWRNTQGTRKSWNDRCRSSPKPNLLRAAFQRLGAPDDPDQLEVFEWLKATAARHHVYIKSFMRADDVADPTRWSDLLARIESLAASGQLSRRQVPRSNGFGITEVHSKRMKGLATTGRRSSTPWMNGCGGSPAQQPGNPGAVAACDR